MGDTPFPFSLDDSVPEKEEISWAVCRLRLNRSGGLSGMRVEHLRQWLIIATQDNSPDATNCLKVVPIVQAEFQDGTLAKGCMWQTVALVKKGRGYFWGIGLIKVL